MTPRRPVLKIVDRLESARAEADANAKAKAPVQHDARGNAVWSAPVDLEQTLELELALDTHSAPVSTDDPYNRGVLHGQPRKIR